MEKNINFEDALKKLEKIISDLEEGEIELDKSISKYKEAMDLVKFCNEKLETATKTINKIMTESGKLEDFKVEE